MPRTIVRSMIAIGQSGQLGLNGVLPWEGNTDPLYTADVARFFGVAPHLIGDASGSPSWGSGLAEQSTNTVTFSFLPWAKRLEEAWTWLARSERPTVGGQRKLFVAIDLDDLKRGDFATRIETSRTAVDSGIYTLDEVRRWEGLPPAPRPAPD